MKASRTVPTCALSTAAHSDTSQRQGGREGGCGVARARTAGLGRQRAGMSRRAPSGGSTQQQ